MKPKLILLTAALLTAATLNTLGADEKEKGPKSPMAAAIADKSGAEFEAEYLALMTLHHRGGQPMWALARERSKNDEILALEKKTTPKEQREIEQMTAWLKQWHGKAPEDYQEPAESKKMMEKDMAELKAASGKEFDALFAKKMARHHIGAIEMGKLAAKKATHEEVKGSGKQIASSQSEDRQKLLKIAEEKK